MSYKNILVHVNGSRHLQTRVEIAAKIALAESSHLTGVALTDIPRIPGLGEIHMQGTDPAIPRYLAAMREQAQQSLEKFDRIAKGLGVLSCEKRLAEDETANGISLHARYSDLVVVSQEDTSESLPAMLAGLPEYVAMSSGSPTLVVPHAGYFPAVGEHVLIAWNASSQAMHAVRGALPLLRRAKNVDVLIYNAAERNEVYGEEPGADIALYLARHGVKVNVRQETTNRQIDIGNAVLSRAAELGSDLLVMGCYGHSRFREMMLGGVTRVILETMTIPVLMAH